MLFVCVASTINLHISSSFNHFATIFWTFPDITWSKRGGIAWTVEEVIGVMGGYVAKGTGVKNSVVHNGLVVVKVDAEPRSEL